MLEMGRQELSDRILELNAQKELLLNYTYIKIREEDFHGAIDSLMDIRDIDAEIKGMEWADASISSDPLLKEKEWALEPKDVK